MAFYDSGPRFDEVSDRLARNDFTSVEERTGTDGRALRLSMEDSVRIFYLDRSSFIPRRAELQVTADLSSGISGTPLWPHTIRFGDASRRHGQRCPAEHLDRAVEPDRRDQLDLRPDAHPGHR